MKHTRGNAQSFCLGGVRGLALFQKVLDMPDCGAGLFFHGLVAGIWHLGAWGHVCFLLKAGIAIHAKSNTVAVFVQTTGQPRR